MFDFILGFSKEIIISATIILVIYIINLIINKVINKIIKRHHQKNITTILVFVKKFKSVILFFVTIGLIMMQFEVFSSISIAILSTLGVSSAIISLSVRDSLSNFLNSIELITSKPFNIGDYINLPEKNISGIVEEISIRHTIIKTDDNNKQILPNKLLNTLIIENIKYINDNIELPVEYSVSYDNDIDKIINIIEEELIEVCNLKVDENIYLPKVKVIEMNPSGIKIRAFVTGENLKVATNNIWNLNYNLKIKFDKAKIK